MGLLISCIFHFADCSAGEGKGKDDNKPLEVKSYGPLETLPGELLGEIVSRLSIVGDLASMAIVSKYIRERLVDFVSKHDSKVDKIAVGARGLLKMPKFFKGQARWTTLNISINEVEGERENLIVMSARPMDGHLLLHCIAGKTLPINLSWSASPGDDYDNVKRLSWEHSCLRIPIPIIQSYARTGMNIYREDDLGRYLLQCSELSETGATVQFINLEEIAFYYDEGEENTVIAYDLMDHRRKRVQDGDLYYLQIKFRVYPPHGANYSRFIFKTAYQFNVEDTFNPHIWRLMMDEAWLKKEIKQYTIERVPEQGMFGFLFKPSLV